MQFMNVELEHHPHKIGLNFWHMEWVTKYRYDMVAKFKYKTLYETCIRKVAKRHNIKICVLSATPDHVHAFVTMPRGMTDSRGLQLIKGSSSYFFFCSNHPKQTLDIHKDIFGAGEVAQ